MTERYENEVPPNRLGEMASRMLDEVRGEENSDVRTIVLLHDEKHGMVALANYDSDGDAVVDLFVHLTAVFKANGKELAIIPVGEG